MKRFVEGQDRAQLVLLPECLDDFVGEDNPVRVVDAFIEELDLALLGFAGVVPEATGRPSYHPAPSSPLIHRRIVLRLMPSQSASSDCQFRPKSAGPTDLINSADVIAWNPI